MLSQQTSDLCDILRWILSVKIAEIQGVIDRYTAYPPENVEQIELVRQQVTWRRYTVAGLKTIRKDLTPLSLERMLALTTPEQETDTYDADVHKAGP